MYFAYAIVFAVVAFYTVLHLVFLGFTGEPVGVDEGLAFIIPLLWISGLLTAIRLRANRTRSLFWGFGLLLLLVILLSFDTVRFQPIFSS